MAGGHGAVRPSAGERSEGKELGQKLLGVARKESPGGEQQQPAQKRRAGGGGGHPDAGLSSSSPAVGSSMNARELWAGIEAHEDEAAMEYLKWELHGKRGRVGGLFARVQAVAGFAVGCRWCCFGVCFVLIFVSRKISTVGCVAFSFVLTVPPGCWFPASRFS